MAQATPRLTSNLFRRIPFYLKLLCLLLVGIIIWRCCLPRHYTISGRLHILTSDYFTAINTGVLVGPTVADARGIQRPIAMSLYDWHGNKVWQIQLPVTTPFLKRMASSWSQDALWRIATSPDGHIVAAACAGPDGYRVQAWRDGQLISRVTIPDHPVANIKLDVIDLTVLDSGQQYFSSTHFPNTRFIVIAASHIVATGDLRVKGKTPSNYYSAVSSDAQTFTHWCFYLPNASVISHFMLAVRGKSIQFTPIARPVGIPPCAAGWEDLKEFYTLNGLYYTYGLERKKSTYRIRSTTRQPSWSFRNPQYIREIADNMDHWNWAGIAADGRSMVQATFGPSYLSRITDRLLAKFPHRDPFRNQQQMHVWQYVYPGILHAENIITCTVKEGEADSGMCGNSFSSDLRHFYFMRRAGKDTTLDLYSE